MTDAEYNNEYDQVILYGCNVVTSDDNITENVILDREIKDENKYMLIQDILINMRLECRQLGDNIFDHVTVDDLMSLEYFLNGFKTSRFQESWIERHLEALQASWQIYFDITQSDRSFFDFCDLVYMTVTY